MARTWPNLSSHATTLGGLPTVADEYRHSCGVGIGDRYVMEPPARGGLKRGRKRHAETRGLRRSRIAHRAGILFVAVLAVRVLQAHRLCRHSRLHDQTGP